MLGEGGGERERVLLVFEGDRGSSLVLCWARCPACCSVVGRIFPVEGREGGGGGGGGGFHLQLTWVLTPTPPPTPPPNSF